MSFIHYCLAEVFSRPLEHQADRVRYFPCCNRKFTCSVWWLCPSHKSSQSWDNPDDITRVIFFLSDFWRNNIFVTICLFLNTAFLPSPNVFCVCVCVCVCMCVCVFSLLSSGRLSCCSPQLTSRSVTFSDTDAHLVRIFCLLTSWHLTGAADGC